MVQMARAWHDCVAHMGPTPSSDEALFAMMLWLGGVILAILAAVLIAAYVRRRTREAMESSSAELGLDELRRLRDRGELTLSQYEALKKRTIAQYTSGNDRRGSWAR